MAGGEGNSDSNDSEEEIPQSGPPTTPTMVDRVAQAAEAAAMRALDEVGDRFLLEKSSSGIITIPLDGRTESYDTFMQLVWSALNKAKASLAITEDSFGRNNNNISS